MNELLKFLRNLGPKVDWNDKNGVHIGYRIPNITVEFDEAELNALCAKCDVKVSVAEPSRLYPNPTIFLSAGVTDEKFASFFQKS